MQVIVTWPNWNVRADRCTMFSHIGEWANRVFLITNEPISDTLASRLHPNSEIIYVGQESRQLAFAFEAGKAADKILQLHSQSQEKFIFHELIIPRLAPQIRLRKRLHEKRYRTVLSLYSPSRAFLRQRAWRPEREACLPWEQELTHWRVTLGRVLSELLSVRLVDAVTGNSEEICQDVVNSYHKPANKVHLLPTAVDTGYFSPCQDLVRDQNTILFLGRMYARKGIYDLIEATALLKSRGMESKLRMMGDNDIEADNIQQAIRNHGLESDIEVLPRQPRDSVRQALQTATLLVLPSYKEGTPRVVKEAMSCGCPVIASDLPGIRALNTTGDALTFVNPGETHSLANAMETLLTDQQMRQQRGNLGRQIVETQFSVQAVAKQTYQLYESIFLV
ncbi:MAG: glycosyltransferase [Anaerolineales bacterium]|nr:glycosyltransferase [Anaerolineales bacterium]